VSKVDATINIKVTNLGELTKLEKRIKKIQGSVNVGQSPEVQGLKLENKELKEKIELLKQENRLENRRNRGGFGRGGRRGRVLSSAAIGGGFPLLFGGGPLQALAGGIGGGLGELARPGGGFAGSIAATAVVSQIQKATDSVAKLGQAMNPLTMDVQKLTQSLGIAGTPAGQYLKVLEQTEGKQAAFNEAMKRLNNEIGTKGVTALKEFGQNVQTITNGLGEFFTKLAAGFAEAANKVAKPIAEQFETSSQLQKAQADLESSRQRIIASRGDRNRGSDGLGGATEFDRAILDYQNNIERVRKLTKQLNQETKQEETDLSNSRLQILNDQLKGIDDQNKFLQDQLTLGEQGAIIEQEKLKFAKAQGIEIDKITDKEAERIANAVKLNEKLQEQKATQEQIQNILATGMTNAVMGLIDGTRTLGSVLADVAKQLASMFLNRAFMSIFSSFGGGGAVNDIQMPSAVAAQGAFSRSGGFKAFQYGGVVNQPTLGLMGEGGESEYVIPASKMSGAMARYSAGARGGAVIPGGSHESGTVAGSSGNAIVEYTGPVLNFNGDEYVPKSAVPEIIGAASKQGAMAGKAQTINALRNSRSQRASLGL
tara:strand:+ start:957 stop:2750 length:1794 start_codon:yes stop_codon:yes gene_type:complete